MCAVPGMMIHVYQLSVQGQIEHNLKIFWGQIDFRLHNTTSENDLLTITARNEDNLIKTQRRGRIEKKTCVFSARGCDRLPICHQ